MCAKRLPVGYLLEVHAQLHADVRVIEDALEHPGIAMLRHGLESVREVTVVGVGAHGNARGHTGLELRRLQSPLLARVVEEEFLVQVAADAVQYHILAGQHGVARLAYALEERRGAGFIKIQSRTGG